MNRAKKPGVIKRTGYPEEKKNIFEDENISDKTPEKNEPGSKNVLKLPVNSVDSDDNKNKAEEV